MNNWVTSELLWCLFSQPKMSFHASFISRQTHTHTHSQNTCFSGEQQKGRGRRSRQWQIAKRIFVERKHLLYQWWVNLPECASLNRYLLLPSETWKHRNTILGYDYIVDVVIWPANMLERTYERFQVNLEAKVGFSSSVGRGLVEEAKVISAEFLLIGRPRNRSNRWVKLSNITLSFLAVCSH